MSEQQELDLRPLEALEHDRPRALVHVLRSAFDGWHGIATVVRRARSGDYAVIMGVHPDADDYQVWLAPQRVQETP